MNNNLPADNQHIDDSQSVSELQQGIEDKKEYIKALKMDIENEESVIKASAKEIARLKLLVTKEEEDIEWAENEIINLKHN